MLKCLLNVHSFVLFYFNITVGVFTDDFHMKWKVYSQACKPMECSMFTEYIQ